MKRLILIFLVFLPALALAETVQQTRELELPAEGLAGIEIICGAGSLSLYSDAKLKTIRVVARIEVEDLAREALEAFIRENVRLNLEKIGPKAVLQSEVTQTAIKRKEARINLAIMVPRGIDAKITDGSGPIRIKDFWGNLDIDDNSGKIEIETAVGNIKITDGSGSIVIEDVQGRVTLKDGSGLIEIYHVQGDVGVSDGSGDIKIQNVDGNVAVNDDSGDIDIKKVSGNVLVSDSGTGEIDIDLVKGKLTILE